MQRCGGDAKNTCVGEERLAPFRPVKPPGATIRPTSRVSRARSKSLFGQALRVPTSRAAMASAEPCFMAPCGTLRADTLCYTIIAFRLGPAVGIGSAAERDRSH